LGDDTVNRLRQLAESAPPMTEAQKDTIRAVFAGGGE
jgi:hypothetical protein